MLAKEEDDWLTAPPLEMAFLMAWQVCMNTVVETIHQFCEAAKFSDTSAECFSAACLSVSCKFVSCPESWQIRSLRRNASLPAFTAMELAVLTAFDWSFEHMEMPMLSGVLEQAGATKDFTNYQTFVLRRTILQVYQSTETITKRLDDPVGWAWACLQLSGAIPPEEVVPSPDKGDFQGAARDLQLLMTLS